MNRIWQAYFGTGLVATSEDFGTQSEPPSHPELLDWLACEFMDRGWSMKALHRLIVHSATYRQVVAGHARAATRKDPYNRLLARGPRFRVEGEIVRDIALAASGLLEPEAGRPEHLFARSPSVPASPPASYAPFTWNEETGPDRYRRALYTFRRRSLPYPVLQNFDTPNGDFSCVRRQRSNTPLQALTTLNEVDLHRVRPARWPGRRWPPAAPSDAERLDVRLPLLRQPAADRGRVPDAAGPARQSSGSGSPTAGPTRARSPPARTSRRPTCRRAPRRPNWRPTRSSARVLLNLDETITKE